MARKPRKGDVESEAESSPVLSEHTAVPEVLEPERATLHSHFIPTQLSVGEIFAGLTILYFASIAAFNAGYFWRMPGRFSDLFTFTDLIGTNITIIQYFAGIYFAVWLTAFAVSMLRDLLFPDLKSHVHRIAIRYHTTPEVGIVVLGAIFLIGLLGIAIVGFLQDVLHVSYLTLALLRTCSYKEHFCICCGLDTNIRRSSWELWFGRRCLRFSFLHSIRDKHG